MFKESDDFVVVEEPGMMMEYFCCCESVVRFIFGEIVYEVDSYFVVQLEQCCSRSIFNVATCLCVCFPLKRMFTSYEYDSFIHGLSVGKEGV